MERVGGGSARERLAALGVESDALVAECDALPARIASYLIGLGEAMAGPEDSLQVRAGLVRALLDVRARCGGGDHALLSQLSHVGKWMATGPADRREVVGRLASLRGGVLRTPLLDEVFGAGHDALALHEALEALEAAGRSRAG